MKILLDECDETLKEETKNDCANTTDWGARFRLLLPLLLLLHLLHQKFSSLP